MRAIIRCPASVGALIDFTRAVFSAERSFSGKRYHAPLIVVHVRSACAPAAFLAAGNCLAATDLQAVVDASVKTADAAAGDCRLSGRRGSGWQGALLQLRCRRHRHPVARERTHLVRNWLGEQNLHRDPGRIAAGRSQRPTQALGPGQPLPAGTARGGKFDHISVSTSVPTPLAACPCSSRRRSTTPRA